MNKRKLILTVSAILILALAGPGWAATYYVRNDGSAANKAAGGGLTTDTTKCMTWHTAATQSYTDGDIILISDKGGSYVTLEDQPGKAASAIIYRAAPGETPVFDAQGTKELTLSGFG